VPRPVHSSERLARYLSRPPIANNRLEQLPDGRLALRLKRAFRDGTEVIIFTPGELVEKLVLLVPRPRKHLTIFHGVLAPASRLRPLIVPGSSTNASKAETTKDRPPRPARHLWADLRSVGCRMPLCPSPIFGLVCPHSRCSVRSSVATANWGDMDHLRGLNGYRRRGAGPCAWTVWPQIRGRRAATVGPRSVFRYLFSETKCLPIMTRPSKDSPGLSPETVRRSWHRFVVEVESLRPDLYRYCRYLVRSPWEAEDLVQDTLAAAFVKLACVGTTIENPRAWLFRVAYNRWLNQVRRTREISCADAAPEHVDDANQTDPRTTREALGTVVSALSPQERAAVVLKDVFDFSLAEIAEMLSTSVGAVKSALSGARGRLETSRIEESERTTPVPQVLDAFVDAFNSRDLERLVGLLLENVTVEFPGLLVEEGHEQARRGSLTGVLFGDPSSGQSGIAAAFRGGLLPRAPRLELRVHRGEPLLLGWFEHVDGEAVRAISRVEVVESRIARMQTYLHHPDVLAEICRELGVPYRSSGYRHWE
jgi:RNA polymerase sigma-70 factor (ECF subfamily)